jgi:hypothetical protein
MYCIIVGPLCSLQAHEPVPFQLVPEMFVIQTTCCSISQRMLQLCKYQGAIEQLLCQISRPQCEEGEERMSISC